MTANVTLLPAEARADIQGFVTSGYGDLPFAAYIFVKISDEAGARRWLGSARALSDLDRRLAREGTSDRRRRPRQ